MANGGSKEASGAEATTRKLTTAERTGLVLSVARRDLIAAVSSAAAQIETDLLTFDNVEYDSGNDRISLVDTPDDPEGTVMLHLKRSWQRGSGYTDFAASLPGDPSRRIEVSIAPTNTIILREIRGKESSSATFNLLHDARLSGEEIAHLSSVIGVVADPFSMPNVATARSYLSGETPFLPPPRPFKTT